MIVFAIDPGNAESAFVRYDAEARTLLEFGKVPNAELNARLRGLEHKGDALVVEMIASYGMPVGREVFETCLWIGRFIEAAGDPHFLVYRSTIKSHLCHSGRATDANIRRALIDRFGPGDDVAIGKKATPGPLYGVKADVWAALAVAVTYSDLHRTPQGATLTVEEASAA